MANKSANSCLFTYPTDTEQHLFGVMFVSTIHSPFSSINSWTKYLFSHRKRTGPGGVHLPLMGCMSVSSEQSISSCFDPESWRETALQYFTNTQNVVFFFVAWLTILWPLRFILWLLGSSPEVGNFCLSSIHKHCICRFAIWDTVFNTVVWVFSTSLILDIKMETSSEETASHILMSCWQASPASPVQKENTGK